MKRRKLLAGGRVRASSKRRGRTSLPAGSPGRRPGDLSRSSFVPEAGNSVCFVLFVFGRMSTTMGFCGNWKASQRTAKPRAGYNSLFHNNDRPPESRPSNHFPSHCGKERHSQFVSITRLQSQPQTPEHKANARVYWGHGSPRAP